MRIFDSHCHLDDPVYDPDRDRVLARMRAAGVRRALVAGVNIDTARRAVALAAETPGVYAAVGFHPHDAAACGRAALAEMARMAASPRVVAWGEIGLDFFRMHSPRPQQEKWFVRQLEIAESLGLPVVLHERDSGGRLLEMLSGRRERYRGVVHCFSGNREELARYLELGLHVGVTGIVTMKQRGAALRRLVPAIPTDRLLVETDAPYLTPAPEKNRTRRNEPAFVAAVLRRVAKVRGEAAEETAAQVWDNTCRLFGIENRAGEGT